MKFPKISIVIPSFNQGKYIEQTITSIIGQHYPSLELIIIDGGSQDNTVDVLKKYNDSITYWVSEPDKGQAHAINKGLAIATGDVFNWINSDDYLEPGALKCIGSYFQKHHDKDILCGYTRCFFDEDGTTSHIYRMGLRKNATDTILNLEMNQPGTFYRTKVINDLGGVNESLRYVFDNELWIRYLGKYGISGVGKTDVLIAQFRLHGSSKSVGDGFDKFQLEQDEMNYAIAKNLNLPAYILNELRAGELELNFDFNFTSFKHISRNKLVSYYSCKYLSKWYHSNNLSTAKTAVKNIFKFDPLSYPFSKKYISIFWKVISTKASS